MGSPFTYDASNFDALYASMDPKLRLKTLRGAFRKEANNVRKVAVRNLRTMAAGKNGKPLRSATSAGQKDLERGIRALPFKKKAGFSVTVGFTRSTKKGMHLTRTGRLKPIVFWGETGTKERRTKGGLHKPHKAGRFPQYGYMSKTRQQASGSVTNSLQTELVDSVKKVAFKYGCR